MKKKNKILIIKLGYSETLDAEISNFTSYGDVLRTTVILHLFKNDHVTWLVDAKAVSLLKNNPFIDSILVYDLTSVLQLQAEHFDTIINLEKVPGICALADSITAWRRYGFRFDVKTGESEAYEGTQNILAICKNRKLKRSRMRCWQDGLFEILGHQWNGEEYILGYRPKSKETHDVGFNYEVGNKWLLKAWKRENWDILKKRLENKYSISWQTGKSNLEEYFEWINSCRVLVTNDSLGMHIAFALKKKVVALFGPTNSNEIYMYGRGVLLTPELDCPAYPCMAYTCKRYDSSCIDLIPVKKVQDAVENLVGEH